MLNFRKMVTLVLMIAFISVALPVVSMAQDDKVNINTAGVEKLTTLDRIGPKYAQRIINFREKNGPFQKPEDIMKIKGIGPKTFEANKDRIVVDDND